MNILNDYLQYIVLFGGMVIWFIRLEGKVNAQEKEIEAFSKIMGKLSEIAERLSFIEGNLKSHGRE